VDGAGNVYFTDLVQSNTPPDAIAIRRVTTDRKINTWAGGVIPGAGFSGDGMSPLQAQFSSSISLAAASDGTLYIADTDNSRVRKIDPAGATITTVAGNGQPNASGNGGPAISAGVQLPFSVTVDSSGSLYIGSLSTIRKVAGGTISAYAGSGPSGFSGDGGPATAATLAFVPGMATDSGNNLYIVDNGNNRVRQVQPAIPPVINLSSTYLTFTRPTTGVPTNQNFTLSNGGQGTLNWVASTSTTSGGTWLSISPSTGSSLAGQLGTTVAVAANPSSLAPGDYYGQIQVTSPNAASPVQMITVRFTIQTAGEDPPAVAAGGVLSDASYALKTPVAPGTFVAIFGSNFTDSTSPVIATTLPFPNQLGGTSVTIGGEPVPLYAVTAGQIDAILPFDLPVNTSLPIVVTRNNAVSAPQPVSMVSSEPGIFTQSQNGLGVGSIEIFRPDGSYEGVAGNGNSATAGDVIVVYCTGLGGRIATRGGRFPRPSFAARADDRSGNDDHRRRERSRGLRGSISRIRRTVSGQRHGPYRNRTESAGAPGAFPRRPPQPHGHASHAIGPRSLRALLPQLLTSRYGCSKAGCRFVRLRIVHTSLFARRDPLFSIDPWSSINPISN
jgi:uncharacterized protein (TIGR03437 family)